MANLTKRILLADDHFHPRQALRELLATRPEWTVCAEASDGIEAVEMAASTRPDVAIVDLQMPRLNGIDAARQILALFPNARILIISSHEPKLIISEIKSTPAALFQNLASTQNCFRRWKLCWREDPTLPCLSSGRRVQRLS